MVPRRPAVFESVFLPAPRVDVPPFVTKAERIDLGLAILSLAAIRGEPLSTYEIAAWCGCCPQAISAIEKRALAKLARKLKQAGLDLREAIHAAPSFAI
jgi:hypothetical protein